MDIAKLILGVDDTRFLHSVEVQLVLLVSAVSSMGSIASPALPAMSSTLGISEARIGLVFTAFTLPAMFVLPVVGAIGDLYGRKVVVVPGLLLFGSAGAAVGLATNFETVLILRGLQGIGYTAFNSLTVALLGDLLSGAEESAAQGSRAIFNKLTAFAGPTVAGVLAGLAWQYPFYLYVVGVPVGILIYLYYEEGESINEKSSDDAPAAGEDEDRSFWEYGRNLWELMSDPFIAGILGGGFVRMFMKYTLYTFLTLAVVSQYGGSDAYAGFLVGVYSGIGAVIASQAARLTKGFTHSYALVLGFLIASVAFMAFPLADGLIAVTVLVLLHGLGEGIINPVHKSIMSQSVREGVRGGLVTTNAIVQNAAKTVTPVVLSPLFVFFDVGGYDYLFFVAGGAALAATVVAFAALLLGTSSERRCRLRAAR